MKSDVEKLSPTKVKISVEVPAADLQPHIDSALSDLGKQIQVPGFRKGKVPTRLIEQRVGRGYVIQEAVNAALPELYGQAIEEHDLRPIGQPDVEITQVPAEGDEPLIFSVDVETRPEIKLPKYEGFKVKVDDVKVTDEDVNERLTELQERFGTLVGVDRKVKKGDFVSIDLTAAIDGETIDSVEDISYEVGSDNMLDGLDKALTGMAKEATKEFQAPLAGGDFEGQKADCVVTVKSVKKRELPELNDDFAQLASEFDTMDELRADVTSQVEQSKKFEQGIQARDKVLEMLIAKTKVDLPEGIIKDQVDQHLESEGKALDDEHREEVEKNTREALTTQFILDELAEVEEVEVGQPELVEYLIMQAQQYGMDPNQFAQIMDSQGQVPAIVSEVGRRKALAAALEKAVVTDASGNTIDLDELMPGGDDEDVAAEDVVVEDEAADIDTEGVDAPEEK